MQFVTFKSHVTAAINHPTTFGVKLPVWLMTWYWLRFEIYMISLWVPFTTREEVCPSSKAQIYINYEYFELCT